MRSAYQAAGRLFPALIAVLAAAFLTAGCGASESIAQPEEKYEAASEEWFYENFDREQRMAYDAFRSAAMDPFSNDPVVICGEDGETAEIPVKDLKTVYQAFLYDHPEVFWLSPTFRYRVCGEFGQDQTADAVAVIPSAESAGELETQKKDFESSAQEILKAVGKAESDKEKAAALYDYLSGAVEYEEEALYDDSLQSEHTAFGAITEKRAVCDGIALAYKYLLNRCGIRCILIPGVSEDMPHIWNTVFWDGEWHETDLTWDIASEENDSRQYFDLTTEEMSKDHIREEEGIAAVVPFSQ